MRKILNKITSLFTRKSSFDTVEGLWIPARPFEEVAKEATKGCPSGTIHETYTIPASSLKCKKDIKAFEEKTHPDIIVERYIVP